MLETFHAITEVTDDWGDTFVEKSEAHTYEVVPQFVVPIGESLAQAIEDHLFDRGIRAEVTYRLTLIVSEMVADSE